MRLAQTRAFPAVGLLSCSYQRWAWRRRQLLNMLLSTSASTAVGVQLMVASQPVAAGIACGAMLPRERLIPQRVSDHPCSALRGAGRPIVVGGFGGWDANLGAGAATLFSPLVFVAAAGPLVGRSVNTPSSWSHMSSVENTNWSTCSTVANSSASTV